MVQPGTGSLPMKNGFEHGMTFFNPSDGGRLLEETYSTTDDCMSSQDDDGEFQSFLHRDREDSSEPQVFPKLGEMVSSEESYSIIDSYSSDAPDRSVALVAAAPSVTEDSVGEQRGTRQKRDISQEDQEDRPQRGHLRKACDLCTKRKRKCNGKHPCSQCIETDARDYCVFSPRLKSGRKKKVRMDGVSFDESSVYGAYESSLVPNLAGRRTAPYAVGLTLDDSAGRFSPSGAVGLVGHMENFFLATYLRDFNRMVPLTSESSVTEGMLEVLSPAVSSRGLATASPIKQPESRRQAKLAVFWGVVAMGSRILGAGDDATAKYLSLMRTALRECFDCNDREVVQAYLLLSTVETMRGNDDAGKRYLDYAHTMHNGNAMGQDGKLIKNRVEQEECLDVVFQMFANPEGRVGGTASAAVSRTSHRSAGAGFVATSAVNQMIEQAMSPPTGSQSGSLKALKFMSTACGLSSEVLDPTQKCVTIRQYLGEIDNALKDANSLFKRTDLSECITGVVMVKILGGVTVLMHSWGQPEDRELGLAQVEEGVDYALTRPGLMTFPMWWHALHTAAIILAHFGQIDTYMRLRATFNKNTFPGTEMPHFEAYSPSAVCPQPKGNCSKLALWFMVRGRRDPDPEWNPKFDAQPNEKTEDAAYVAALGQQYVRACRALEIAEKENTLKGQTEGVVHNITTPLQPEAPSNERALRAALDAGLSEIAQFSDPLGPNGAMSLTSLGAEFDLSDVDHATANFSPSFLGHALAGGMQNGEGARDPVQVPAATSSTGGTVGVVGGGELLRHPSFGITGHAAASALVGGMGGMGTSLSFLGGAEPMSRQNSLDLNIIMQMATSDEELIKNKGGPDAMDRALAFGEGPAKEIFGVDL